MTRFLIKCIAFELITIVLVGLTFHFISNPLIAGRVAGMLFISLGLYICSRGIGNREFRRSYSFMISCVHLTLSLAMVITRLIYSEGSFASVRVLGIPGIYYHKIASAIYLLLIFATCFDFYKYKTRK